MKYFADGWWLGIVLGVATLVAVRFLLWWGYQAGHQAGWEQAIQDQERAGAGRWISVTLDGRRLEGWLH